MDNSALSKYSTSFGLSLAVASVFNALLVVAKEKSPAVLAGMKRLTGQHWITHVVIVLILFLALGFGLALANGGKGLKLAPKSLIVTLVSGVALGGLIIVGFYLVAD
jgi:hypothetical protein